MIGCGEAQGGSSPRNYGPKNPFPTFRQLSAMVCVCVLFAAAVLARAIVLQPTPTMPVDTFSLMLFVFRDIGELFSGVLLPVFYAMLLWALEACPLLMEFWVVLIKILWVLVRHLVVTCRLAMKRCVKRALRAIR